MNGFRVSFRIIILSVLAWVIVPAVRAQNVVHIDATAGVFTAQTPGSYIGGANGFSGGDQTFSSADGWVFTPETNFVGGVSFQFSQTGFPGLPQSLDFAGPSATMFGSGAVLAVGNYPGGTAYPYETQPNLLGRPACDFDNETYADTEFQILDLAYDPATGLAMTFAANFVQRDPSDPTIAIYGQIRYNSTIPVGAGQPYLQFDQATYTVLENAGELVVTVTREGPSGDAASVAYTTVDNTAKAGLDYTPASGTLTWAAGDSSPKTFAVPIINNTVIDGSRAFAVELTGDEVGAPSVSTVTITDDDVLPPSLLHFHVYGSEPDDETLTTAAGFDFNESSSNVGQSGTSFDINNDNTATFFDVKDFHVNFGPTDAPLQVGSYTGQAGDGGLGFTDMGLELSGATTDWQILFVNYGVDGTLLQLAANFEAHDSSGNLVYRGELRYHSTLPLRGDGTLASATFQGSKSGPGIVVTVDHEGDASSQISVNYSTADYSAVKKVDYLHTHGTLTWAAGDTSPKIFTIPVLDNPASGSRVLFVRLTGDSVGETDFATVTIVDESLPQPVTLPEPNGTIDTSFGLGLTSSTELDLSTLTALPDGSVLVGGNFGSVSGQTQPGIALVSSAGLPDFTFHSPISLSVEPMVNSVVVQPDGKILIGGRFQLASSGQTVGLARLNADGSVDGSFNPIAGVSSGIVTDFALQSDGRIVVASGSLARLNTDGSQDGSFVPPTNQYENAYEFVVMQPDGKFLVGDEYGHVIRLKPNGSMDASFLSTSGTGRPVSANAVVLQPDGKFILPSGSDGNGLTRYNYDGTVDLDFILDPAVAAECEGILALKLQPDGKLLIGYASLVQNGTTISTGVVRLNTDGSLDPSFHLAAGLPAVISAMILGADGSLIISAADLPTGADGSVRTVLARLAGVSPGLPAVTVIADVPKAVESTSQNGEVTLTRTGDLSVALKVAYTVTGNAVAGVDYVALPGRKNIKAGASTATIKIVPLPTASGRGPRSVKIRVLSGLDYTVDTPAAAKVKIVDFP